MRIVSLNVAIFEANNEGVFKFLNDIKPDILCLQEITEKLDPMVNPQYLSKDSIDKATSDLEYSYFAPTWIIKDFTKKNFHKKESFNFEFGGFVKTGNYIKSKYKITNQSNVFVQKDSPFKVEDWSKWPKEQSKAVQVVDLELPSSKKLRVLNYHGIWTKEKLGNDNTLKACRKILSLTKEVSYPSIITGDFNLFPDTESMKVFQNNFISLVDTHEIKTTRPKSNELSHLERNVVDYILVSKNIKVNSFSVLETDVSDHLPLILDFEVN